MIRTKLQDSRTGEFVRGELYDVGSQLRRNHTVSTRKGAGV